MEPKKTEIEILQKAMRQYNKDRFGPSIKHGLIEQRDLANRQSQATRVQQEVFNKATKALGLDFTYLEERHAKDNEAARDLGKKQLQSIRSHGKRLLQTHKRNIRKVRSLKNLFEYERGNPNLTVCNWFASDVSPMSFLDGAELTDCVIIQGNAGENVLRTKLSVESSGRQLKSGLLTVEHDFIWQSDRAGMLDAVGWLNIIGAWDMFSPGSCFRTSLSTILIQADLSVSQQISGQQTLILSSPQVTILDKRMEGGCVAVVSTGNPASMRTGDVELTRDNFPLQSNKAVLATTTLVVLVQAWAGGEAMFDVESDPSFQYNVPSVWLIIDS